MIVGHSRNNKLHWHGLIGDRLLCQPEILANRLSIVEWTPRLFMCQRCVAKLDAIDPKWQAKPKTLDDIMNTLIPHRNITNS